FYSLSDFSTEYRDTHHNILSKIEKQVVYLRLSSKDKSVACGMGVLDGDYFGLFSILTAANYRNQGFGGEITAALMNWASENEAVFAYLQVQVDNSPAFYLYRKYSFKPVYEYWYRIQPEVSTP
ncbi:MAG: GNAT family N-acetyltransferase, partial [Anaerolineales bacterium]|nr:GNAT family N-acetyltransferase [Anaerolineales bacterium]